jgi:hypothetical protein
MPPDATYVFKHALIQENAYQSMLVSRRRQLHERIGDTLVERFPEVAGMQPEVVAHHYTEAGLANPAIDYWQRAGQRAVERPANLEGIAHLTKALSVLATLPAGRERLERELVKSQENVHPRRLLCDGGCRQTTNHAREVPRMDVHKNARTPPHSRALIAQRVVTGESAVGHRSPRTLRRGVTTPNPH